MGSRRQVNQCRHPSTNRFMLAFTKLRSLTTLVVLAMLAASSANADDYGRLVFSDDFDRNESQELKDEPANGWTF